MVDEEVVVVDDDVVDVDKVVVVSSEDEEEEEEDALFDNTAISAIIDSDRASPTMSVKVRKEVNI